MLNVSVQLSAPRWVTARALSLYSSALTGGIAIGAWAWGVVAPHSDVGLAFLASGGALTTTVAMGLADAAAARRGRGRQTSQVDIGYEPDVAMA
jgi:predicted MFS family arabinose efflux permease